MYEDEFRDWAPEVRLYTRWEARRARLAKYICERRWFFRGLLFLLVLGIGYYLSRIDTSRPINGRPHPGVRRRTLGRKGAKRHRYIPQNRA